MLTFKSGQSPFAQLFHKTGNIHSQPLDLLLTAFKIIIDNLQIVDGKLLDKKENIKDIKKFSVYTFLSLYKKAHLYTDGCISLFISYNKIFAHWILSL